MSTCRIIGAGDFSPALLPEKFDDDDLLIAADGGYEYLAAAGVTPDVCVGDYDSLGFVPADENTVVLPVVKDDTDIIYAARMGLERGYKEFAFYGVLGGKRFSHSVAALQTLMFLVDNGACGEIIDENCRIIIASDETVVFPAQQTGEISVLCMTDNAVVTERGLFYTLEKAQLTNRFPLGVSNHFIGETAEITVHSGIAVIIIEANA